ncbi:TPA: hypothetical protein ACE8AD_002070 [Neisseria gonorrhoeae]
MPYSLSYLSPTGNEYEFLQGSDGGPFIELDTLTGFVAQFEDMPVSSVGLPGATVDIRDRVIHQMEGSFTLVVFSHEQWRQVRRDFSTREEGTLILDDGNRLELPCRLAASLPTPGRIPKVGARLEVSMIADGGVWESATSASGRVEVTNWGDVPIWPSVVWSGDVGDVVLPSGVEFRLPSVSGEHRLPLDRRASGKAVNLLTGERINTDAVSEMVPVNQSRVYTVPSGARLEWRVGLFDPWN